MRKMTKLEFFRRQKGLTQVELSELLGITQPRLSQIERGKSYPNVPTAIKMADLFGVSLEELLK